MLRLLLPCLAGLLFVSGLNASSPAEQAWHKGQQAMQADRIQEAIGHFKLCLRLDSKFAQAYLSLAAAHLALGEEKLALPHLESYLRARPEHFLIRLHYSELLSRLDRLEDATRHLERVVREMQEHPRVADEHLVGCHTRLMEIARELGDDHAEHLNRGIGLYLLAKKRAEVDGETSQRICEELLCKAAAELSVARMRRPDEARACWYLHGVWTQLSQRQPAVRCLRKAEEMAPFSETMTVTEKRDLYLACAGLRIGPRNR
jgi:tetratricopeptide (TPR) repeat protein